MIIINCGLKQTEVIEVVEKIEIEKKNPFKFVKKQGIQLYFNSECGESEEVCMIIKKEIKSQSFGSALFFNVTVV